MTDYKCYLLDAAGKIYAAHEIGAEADRDALGKAREMFGSQAFEVWQQDRRVYPPPTALDPTTTQHAD